MYKERQEPVGKMNNKDIKLFTVGPAQMYQHTIDVRNQVVPYFRTPEFSVLCSPW